MFFVVYFRKFVSCQVEALRQIVGQEGEDPQLAEQLEESFAQHALGAVWTDSPAQNLPFPSAF